MEVREGTGVLVAVGLATEVRDAVNVAWIVVARDGVRVAEGRDEAVGVRVEVFVAVNVEVGLRDAVAEGIGTRVLLGVLEGRMVTVGSGVRVEVKLGV